MKNVLGGKEVKFINKWQNSGEQKPEVSWTITWKKEGCTDEIIQKSPKNFQYDMSWIVEAPDCDKNPWIEQIEAEFFKVTSVLPIKSVSCKSSFTDLKEPEEIHALEISNSKCNVEVISAGKVDCIN